MVSINNPILGVSLKIEIQWHDTQPLYIRQASALLCCKILFNRNVISNRDGLAA